jgi:hypothetical protein
MATKCASFVRGRVIRATRLDECGNPVEGDDSVVVSKGWTSVAFTANTDEGEEISVPNAAGETCVREPAKPSFLGYSVEITFCQVDPDVFALLTGQRTIVDDNGDVIGFTMDTAVSAGDVRFALEVWAGAPGGNACDNPNAQGSYGYFLLPLVQGGVVGDFTIENAEVTFTISGATTLDGNRWGTGLHPALLDNSGNAAMLADPLVPTDHMLGVITGLKPPAAHCGARPYMDPNDPAVTGGGAVATDLSVTFTPVGPSSTPWWIDYGDGSWEYSADGDPLTHVYASAGTYTYTVNSGSSSFTGTVTATAP